MEKSEALMTKRPPNLLKNLLSPSYLVIGLGLLLCLIGCQNDSEKELMDNMQNVSCGLIIRVIFHHLIPTQVSIYSVEFFKGLI